MTNNPKLVRVVARLRRETVEALDARVAALRVAGPGRHHPRAKLLREVLDEAITRGLAGLRSAGETPAPTPEEAKGARD
jgi:hypothetical protein